MSKYETWRHDLWAECRLNRAFDATCERADRASYHRQTVELARAAEDGGADALTVANTFLAMAIDTDTFKPRMHTITGGLSGPAIRPITLRMAHQCAHAVKIPVIGLGGITRAEDAVEYFLAGASAVQVGTASFYDPRAPLRVLADLEKFLKRRGLSSIRTLVGQMKQ